ncbi:MAG: gluconate 2-dehydrogenase subunit 3 family protein [Pseudomonadota bacterium]
MNGAYVPKVDRRTALAWIGAAGVAGAAGLAACSRKPEATGVAGGYGTDPRLVNPDPAPWPRLLTEAELQAAAILADYILPATAAAPAASALGVPEFIDEWISAPYPDQLADRPLIRDGLKALGARPDAAALAALRASGSDFFKRFRALTIGAYYTTEAGFKDIGYIGNIARESDPGPSAEVKAAVERELKKLGL